MTRTSWSSVLGLVLLTLPLGACVSYSSLRYAPAIRDTELRGEADDLQARMLVAWLGVEERDGLSELRFRVRVENPGDTPFTLVPLEFELLDGALTPFGAARAENAPAAVEAGGEATFELAFPVPRGELGDLDLGVLTLHARLQDGRWEWSTTFQRDAPERNSSWGFRFGVSWIL